MRLNNRSLFSASLLLMAAIALSGCIPGVNGSVHVPPGAHRQQATTVNGSVNVGNGARVGDATTVNGSVHLGDGVTADSVNTVNGGVQVGSNTKVGGDVRTVNGGVHLDSGADISGDLATVNGGVRLDAAHVGGGIEMVNGNLHVGTGSHVEGGIHVHKSHGDFSKRLPRVVIAPGATVDGTLRFDREVKLYVSDSATIGTVVGATAIRFSGDRPDDSEAATASRGGPDFPAP